MRIHRIHRGSIITVELETPNPPFAVTGEFRMLDDDFIYVKNLEDKSVSMVPRERIIRITCQRHAVQYDDQDYDTLMENMGR